MKVEFSGGEAEEWQILTNNKQHLPGCSLLPESLPDEKPAWLYHLGVGGLGWMGLSGWIFKSA